MKYLTEFRPDVSTLVVSAKVELTTAARGGVSSSTKAQPCLGAKYKPSIEN